MQSLWILFVGHPDQETEYAIQANALGGVHKVFQKRQTATVNEQKSVFCAINPKFCPPQTDSTQMLTKLALSKIHFSALCDQTWQKSSAR